MRVRRSRSSCPPGAWLARPIRGLPLTVGCSTFGALHLPAPFPVGSCNPGEQPARCLLVARISALRRGNIQLFHEEIAIPSFGVNDPEVEPR